jgi:Fe-S-cluster-containing hydrogenase component 2
MAEGDAEWPIQKRQLVKVIESPVDFIRVDQDKCVGCKNCAIICGMNLRKVSDGKARLAADYKKFCTECASCFTVCDYDAIKFNFRPPGCGIVYQKGRAEREWPARMKRGIADLQE